VVVCEGGESEGRVRRRVEAREVWSEEKGASERSVEMARRRKEESKLKSGGSRRGVSRSEEEGSKERSVEGVGGE
jgi:hypothetical protein